MYWAVSAQPLQQAISCNLQTIFGLPYLNPLQAQSHVGQTTLCRTTNHKDSEVVANPPSRVQDHFMLVQAVPGTCSGPYSGRLLQGAHNGVRLKVHRARGPTQRQYATPRAAEVCLYVSQASSARVVWVLRCYPYLCHAYALDGCHGALHSTAAPLLASWHDLYALCHQLAELLQ